MGEKPEPGLLAVGLDGVLRAPHFIGTALVVQDFPLALGVGA